MFPLAMPPPIPETPPARVIIIQADDLGSDDLGFNGNPLAHTPNLDALAKNSIRVVDFNVNPVCAPSRATLLTGRHFLRTGVSHVHGGKDFLHRDERTLADAFRAADWRTGMWGKWHLGRLPGYSPWDRGFDEAYAAQLYKHEDTRGEFNGRPVAHEKWCDDVIVDYAVDFLDRHRDQPTFLYLPSLTPHTPLLAPEDWIDFHRDRGVPGNLAVVNAMVSSLDQAVGRLVDHLRATDCLDDALLIFTSDNGPAINNDLLTPRERSLRKISARRGWKGDLWENGVRAPLLIHWPAGLSPGIVAAPLDQVDLLPTILDWCQVAWPADHPPLDGTSRRPLLEAAMGDLNGGDQPIFNYAHPGWITSERPYTPTGIDGEYDPVTPAAKAELAALDQPISVRRGRFKLLLNPLPAGENADPTRVLVDLHLDPGESTNVIDQHPEVATALEAELTDWFVGIRQSPHSFTAPRIDLAADQATVIPAKLPARLDGKLQNTISDLRGWRHAGDAAHYQIRTPAERSFFIRLTWRDAPPAGCALSIRAGTNEVRATTDGRLDLKFPPPLFTPDAAELSIALDTAPGAKPTDEPLRLFQIEFTPVKAP